MLGLLCYFSSSAQSNAIDIVTLKNGSVIRGIIIEQIPNKSIKVQTADGSIFVYAVGEVERINREQAHKSSRPLSLGQSNGVSDGRKGYIGLGLGASFGKAGNSGATGLNLNLIDFGYLFQENIGIAGKWGGQGYSEGGIGFGIGYLMAGPMASWRANPNTRLEAKAMIGFGGVTIPELDLKSEIGFAYGFEFQTRFQLSEKASFLTFVGYNALSIYNAFSMGIGIAFRLK